MRPTLIAASTLLSATLVAGCSVTNTKVRNGYPFAVSISIEDTSKVNPTNIVLEKWRSYVYRNPNAEVTGITVTLPGGQKVRYGSDLLASDYRKRNQSSENMILTLDQNGLNAVSSNTLGGAERKLN
jgi:hypothetical protein